MLQDAKQVELEVLADAAHLGFGQRGREVGCREDRTVSRGGLQKWEGRPQASLPGERGWGRGGLTVDKITRLINQYYE